MMEDLQQAYAAYQQALYHLRDPKVSPPQCSNCSRLSAVGTQIMVRYWYFIRSLWLSGACRRGIFPGHAYAAGLRKGKRDLLPSWNNIQTATEVRSKPRGNLLRPLY